MNRVVTAWRDNRLHGKMATGAGRTNNLTCIFCEEEPKPSYEKSQRNIPPVEPRASMLKMPGRQTFHNTNGGLSGLQPAKRVSGDNTMMMLTIS